MSAFDLLSEPIRRYIYDKGWQDLRPIQTHAIQKIMGDDRNYILVSPTASGKTEAAFLPILSKIDIHQPGVAVLYISPLIALINDQFVRIDDLCKYLDIPVTRWHGEANRTDKEHLIAQPSGIVLITPESIEAMLINKAFAARKLFSNLRYVIIDEIHSFLGTDRGLQLMSLLSRLQGFQTKPAPIVALSATLGDYQPAKEFTGNPTNTAILRDSTVRRPDAEFRYYDGAGSELPLSLLKDIYQEVHDKKALIFPNTRGRTEEIAVKLKKIAGRVGGHEHYFSHHSSVDKEVREFIEDFAKQNIGHNFAIACTSTLELGIDIGAVDTVVQVDATFSISSLVQRVGRSGRRDDAKSRLVFYATNEWSLLQAIACWHLYTEGFIEPRAIDVQAYDILFHQLLSMIKQTSGAQRPQLLQTLQKNTAFKNIAEADIQQLIEHLLEKGILEQLRDELIIGVDGEPIVNSRDFYSVFTTDEQFKVFNGSAPIGELPYGPQIIVGENILLAARIWSIVSIDEKSKRIEVRPASDGKQPSFFGSAGSVHPHIREKMLELLVTDKPSPLLNEPAALALHNLRQKFTAFRPAEPADSVQPVDPVNHADHAGSISIDPAVPRPLYTKPLNCQAYTFSGTAINRTLSLILKHFNVCHVHIEQESAFYISHPKEDFLASWSKIKAALSAAKPAQAPTANSAAPATFDPDQMIHDQLANFPILLSFSKWAEHLPLPFQVAVLKNRHFDFPGAIQFIQTTSWDATHYDPPAEPQGC